VTTAALVPPPPDAVRAMTTEERVALVLFQGPAVWRPLTGPQLQGYVTLADETFYGGSAGGGKSDLLLGLASTAHRRSVIFRREYPQLRGLIDRSQEMFAGLGRYNGQDHVWRDLPGDRRIEFGAVQHATDVTAWQGRPHDFVGFDEISNFLESQYRFLIGWLRTTTEGQRCRVVCAGNPPTTPEGAWVVAYWAPWLDAHHPNPAKPGELRWFAVLDGEDVERPNGEPFAHDGETVYPKSRTFVPARLADNPYLERTGYGAVLQGMPEPLRSQMLYGDFSIGLDDDPWQVIPTAWVRAAQQRWLDRAEPTTPATAVGVDVARGGKDKTVIARRHGAWFAPLEKHPGSATPDGQAVAGLVLAGPGAGAPVNVDAIGVGASVVDQLRGKVARLRAVNVAAAAPGRDRTGLLEFVNLRAYAVWAFREALDPVKGDGVALPPDPELVADLCAARWAMRTNGVQVESKEDIVKRLGRSPDAGEAVILAALAPAAVVEEPSSVRFRTSDARARAPTDAQRRRTIRGPGVNPFLKPAGG
jgi:hypothetical protein